MINQRCKKAQISRMVLSDDTTLDNAKSVHLGASQYFWDFLSTSCEVVQADLSSLIDPVILNVENNMLCAEPTEMEVKEALFQFLSKAIWGQTVIQKLVSHEQGAFVSGRSIFENITLAQEMVHTFHKKIWGGQKISREKSVIFSSKLINPTRKRELLRVTGFKECHFPVIYLGAALVTGRLTSRIIDPLVEEIRKKVAGWKFQLLSQGGRLILLRHVLSSLPLHILLVINAPKVTLDLINSILANFLWGEVEGKRK
ncbi:hypothetical protein Ddye_016353 [Dipteronia dyeriana]|uniref:Reverse transcriptase n=1 Tax=Dipteronia dyeriana TaxID=168575 RepID=A0AAD9U735_9ROSI|nr:hypothetical protein Ddye_016353 [Dipteronia dyeriana]